MKKTGILNQPISAVIAGMGHKDTLVVADAGLPIPPETERIDLALREGLPSFLDTVGAILMEMEVERAIVAEEMLEVSPELLKGLKDLLGDVSIETVSHGDLKARSRSAQAVVRTGEFTPYANVILVAGVVF
jgi:D-ribose pyranase